MRSTFYLFFSLWSAVMVIIGFWPGYFNYLAQGNIETQLIIHIHAIVFTGWLILFFVQAWQVYKGNIRGHMAIGKIGIYYGVLILATGIVTSLIRNKFHLASGNDAAAFFSMAAGLRDMVVFGCLFAIAIYFRKNPQLHRVWIMGASSYLLVPAVSRAAGFLFDGNSFIFYSLWLLPVFVVLMLDFQKRNPYVWHYFLILIVMIASAESLSLLRSIFMG